MKTRSLRWLLAVLVILAVTATALAASPQTQTDPAKLVDCADCGGVGVVLNDSLEAVTCDACGGSGLVPSSSNMYATFWGLVPPVVAIVLALITKEVYSSLFVGIVLGGLFYANFNFIGTMDAIVNDGLITAVADTAGIFIFLVVLGIMVALVNKAGGSAAFGRWAQVHIKSRTGAHLH